MTDTTIFAPVSFVKAPLAEMGDKLKELEALGWKEGRRGNPWVVVLEKDFPTNAIDDALPELQTAFGAYWLTPEESKALAANMESWPPELSPGVAPA